MNQDKTLVEILKQYGWDCDKDPNCGNKIFPAHTYLEVYDKLFSIFKTEKINVLEIGILRGISLKLWSEYFINANIYGVDTFERGGMGGWPGCTIEEVSEFLKDYERVKLIKLNSASNTYNEVMEREAYLSSIPDGFFHIIIDDGSHELLDQSNTFFNFKSKLNKDGIFVVEDIGITNGVAIEPSELVKLIPELKLIDMRYPNKYDNALALYYDETSINFNHFESYYKSNHWKYAKEFTLDYILEKQREPSVTHF